MTMPSEVGLVQHLSNRYEQEEESESSPLLIQNKIPNRRNPQYHPSDKGIDKVLLNFLIHEPSFESDQWETYPFYRQPGTEIHRGTLTLTRGPIVVHLVAFKSDKYSWKCSLEFNPSRFVDPIGVKLCSPKDFKRVVRKVMKSIAPYVTPFGETPDFQVRRVDIARNFYEVSDPTIYFHALLNVPKPHATLNRLYSNPRSLRVESVEAGSKSGGKVSLYDKGAESGRAPKGMLRFEIQAKGWAKRIAGIETLADLTEEKLSKLVSNRVIWFDLEALVMSSETALLRIYRDKTLTRTVRRGLAEYFFARGHGLVIDVCTKTARDYDQLLRERGIASYGDSIMNQPTTRLDFESGTEIQVA